MHVVTIETPKLIVNMISSFDTRLNTLLKKLDAATACDSAESAFELLCTHWLETNIEHESPASMQHYIRSRRLVAEQGWKGLETTVCYLDSSEMPSIRLYLHQDGTIVIQRIESSNSNILYSKPGRPHLTLASTAVPQS